MIESLEDDGDWFEFSPTTRTDPADRELRQAILKLRNEFIDGVSKALAVVSEPKNRFESQTVTVRMPKTLHKLLSEEARKARTSINQLCLAKLSIPLPEGVRAKRSKADETFVAEEMGARVKG